MNAVVLLVLLAPVPMTKAAPPALKHGSYMMTWRGVPAQAVFHADGFYACQWQGRWWHGHWKQEKGLVTVEEWPMEEPHRRGKWTIKLTGPLAGDMTGTPWKLTPQVFGTGGDA